MLSSPWNNIQGELLKERTINMNLKDCVEAYKKDPVKYKGFHKKCDEYYFSIKEKIDKVNMYDKSNDSLFSLFYLFTINDILSEDWELLENEIPEGFVKSAWGDYRKQCKVDIWAIICWDTIENKEVVYGVYDNEPGSKCQNFKDSDCRWKYLKTLHLAQQHSIGLEDIKQYL